MLNMNFSESDWRLFRKKISKWQELYMDKLCEEYIAILSSTSRHSERFWRIEKCVNNDKKM